MKDVIQATQKFLAQYGAGEHTSKQVFLFGQAEGVKGLYPAMVKYATRVGRGKFVVDQALVDALTRLDSNKANAARERIAKQAEAQKLKAERAAERAEAKAKADVERAAKKAAREAAKAEKAKAKAEKPVKAAVVKAAKIKAKKDKKMSDKADAGVAVVKEAQLSELGFKEVDKDTAATLFADGNSVMIVDSALGDVATPPIASDFALKSDTVRFYAK